MKACLGAVLLLLVAAPAAAAEIVATGACPAEVHDEPASVLAAARAAFAAGADWMALSLRVTPDGQVAVALDDAGCRPREILPSLRTLLIAFPEGRFLLDMRGGQRDAGETMIAHLKAAAAGGIIRPGRVKVYSTGDAIINQQAAGALPAMAAPGMVMSEAARCLESYAERGVFPRSCIGAEIPFSIGALRNMGPYAADAVKAVHAVRGRAHVLGVSSAGDYRFAEALSPDFIWTDRIEALGR